MVRRLADQQVGAIAMKRGLIFALGFMLAGAAALPLSSQPPDSANARPEAPPPLAHHLMVEPAFKVELPPNASASPLRELTQEEFGFIAAENAGCMDGIESRPLSVQEQNRENCRQLRALRPADFVASDLTVPAGYTGGTMILPRAGGTACREGGCFWHFFSEDGGFAAAYSRETGLLGDMLEPYGEGYEP